jgi:outer membrane protein OmpA-like peptidoglycan-associated protein
MRLAVSAIALVVALASPRAGVREPPAPSIPLCAGLTVVTAVNDPQGDYESIKTIQAVTDSEVRLKYSSERMVMDELVDDKPKLQVTTGTRTMRREDLRTATLYQQWFGPLLPDLIPETTSLGTSAAVLNELKTKGEASMGIFIGYNVVKVGINREEHPNVYDNQEVATVTRVGKTPVMLPVLLNDVPVSLPAIQAAGDFFGDKSEFFFLDDPANPLALKFRIGIGAVDGISAEEAKDLGVEPRPPGDRESLQVIKITTRCGGGPPDGGGAPGGGSGAGARAGGGAGAGAGGAGAGAGGGAGGSAIERELAESGRADVYSIYFSFNSDVLRPESDPTLREIAGVLTRHPDWALAVNGHTDGIGGDDYNLDLSKRRAAAVRTALVSRFGVPAARLSTAGFGKSQPKDTNATLEGRARNRRVELVKR